MSQEMRLKIYGLIGCPVKHSLSALMHNAAFAALKINAEYRLFELKPEEVEGFLKGLSQKNILGLNVTIPYKEKVIPFLDRVSEEVKIIGAVNTIKFSGGKLEGFNTDGEGFIRHLMQDLAFAPRNKTIAILGAGGASKAVCVALARKNPKSIAIFDADSARAEGLVAHLKENFSGVEFIWASTIAKLSIASSDLLVNATPVGMKGTDPLLVDEGTLQKNTLVYDLIYNPKETKLLIAATNRGCAVSNGLGMLLYQGTCAFKLWTNKEAPVKIMREALEEGAKSI